MEVEEVIILTDRVYQMVPAVLTKDKLVVFDTTRDAERLDFDESDLTSVVQVALCSKDIYRWFEQLEEME